MSKLFPIARELSTKAKKETSNNVAVATELTTTPIDGRRRSKDGSRAKRNFPIPIHFRFLVFFIIYKMTTPAAKLLKSHDWFSRQVILAIVSDPLSLSVCYDRQ